MMTHFQDPATQGWAQRGSEVVSRHFFGGPASSLSLLAPWSIRKRRWGEQRAGLHPTVSAFCSSATGKEVESGLSPKIRNMQQLTEKIKINSCAPRRMNSAFHSLTPPPIPTSPECLPPPPHMHTQHPHQREGPPLSLGSGPLEPSHTRLLPSLEAPGPLSSCLEGSECSGQVAGGGWRGASSRARLHLPDQATLRLTRGLLQEGQGQKRDGGGGGGESGEAEAGPGAVWSRCEEDVEWSWWPGLQTSGSHRGWAQPSGSSQSNRGDRQQVPDVPPEVVTAHHSA